MSAAVGIGLLAVALALLPAIADRLALRFGASPVAVLAVALLALLGLAAIPVALALWLASGARAGAVPESVALLVLALVCGRAVARATAARRRLRQIGLAASALARVRGDGVGVLPCAEPLAFTVANRTFVSEGLLAALGGDQEEAVLFHERAHLRARHGRLAAFAATLRAGLFGLPPARRAADLLQAELEVHADRVAARELGDGQPVAQALERLGDDEEVRRRLLRLGQRGGLVGRTVVVALLVALGGGLVATVCLSGGQRLAIVGAIACLVGVFAFAWFLVPLLQEERR